MANWSNSQSRSNLMYPLGRETMQGQYRRLNRGMAVPLMGGFGFGQTEGPGAARQRQFERQLGTATGPMADFIREGRGVISGMMPGLQQVGTDIAGRAGPAYQALLDSINQGQGLLGQGVDATQAALGQIGGAQAGLEALSPQMQQVIAAAFGPQAQIPLQAGQQALDYAQRSAQEAFGPEARQGLGYAQQAAQGVFSPEAGMGLDLARQAAQQAFSPLQNQTLFNQALRQGTDAARQGMAARGMLGGGAGQAGEESLARDLATQFAARQTAEQQQALSGLGSQQANLANLQQQGALGVTNAFQSMLGGQQAAQAGLGGAAGNLQGLQAGLQGLQTGALGAEQARLAQMGQLAGLQSTVGGQLAALGPVGAQLASMGLESLPQLQQALAAQYSLPMAGMQDLLGFFTGTASPGMSLLEATRPIGGQRSDASSRGILWG